MCTSSQVQKDIRITHLNHWPKNLINKYIHYKSNVLSTFSWLEPVLTPALDIGIAKSGSNLVHSPPSHILCRTPRVKARKSFHGVLPCLVMMHHQANLDCKSFSISEDLVETIVALTLNIAKWYFWMILWLMRMHHHTKFDRSEILSGQTFTLKFRTFTVALTLNTAKQNFYKTLQLMNMHCQTKLVAPKNLQFRTYNRNSHIWLYEPKFSYCDLDLEDGNPFFAYFITNDVSPYWVWLQMVQRCIRYHPN